MADFQISRREFLSTAGGVAAWLALQGPLLASLSACGREAARRGDDFKTLTAAQGRALAAVADRIIPGVDGLPGAREAGATHFIDLVLGGPLAPMKDVVVGWLADLNTQAKTQHAKAPNFTRLPPSKQDQVLQTLENTPPFDIVRMLVIFGTLSDPKYGGNRDGAGWRLVGLEHSPSWQPPFGYYDAQWMRKHRSGS